MRNSLICIFLSVFGLLACTEADDLTYRDADGVVVSFTTPGMTTGDVNTRAVNSYVPLDENTTVRILVYRRTGATADMATDTYIGENTYAVTNTYGDLVACAVDANGKIDPAGTVKDLRLIQGKYDFYAITPALEVTKEASNNARKVSVNHGVDYATSLTENAVVTTTSGTVSLETLDRKCSLLQFAVDRKSENTTSIAIDEVTLTAMTNEPLSVRLAKDMGLAATTPRTQSITLPGSMFTPGIEVWQADGRKIVLPKWGADFKLGMKLKFNGTSAQTVLTPVDIAGLAFSQGTSYTFKIKLVGGSIRLDLIISGWDGDMNVNAGDMGASNSLTINVGTWNDVDFDGSTGNVTGSTGTWEGNKDWEAELGKNPGLTLPNTPIWTGDNSLNGSPGNITGNGNGSWTDTPNGPDFPGGGTNPLP